MTSSVPHISDAVGTAGGAAVPPPRVLGSPLRDFSFLRDDPERARVLVVDDSPTARAAMVRALGNKYEYAECDNTLDAIRKVRSGAFDVVVADVIMPGLSGVELLRMIVAEHPATSVIMVTSVDRSQRVLDAVRQGAFDYLIKPVDPAVLAITVERAVERQRLLREAAKYRSDLEERNAELAARKAELETLQVQMVQSAKMASLGRLAAGVAHELNNPVAFIHSNLDLLQRDVAAVAELLNFYENAELPAHVRAEAERIRSELGGAAFLEETGALMRDCMEGAERIASIVKNLRTFSRLDEAELKRCDIHEGIDASVRLLSRYFTSGNVRLEREYGDIPPIEVYAGQLNQVWMNLLANAAQALPESGGTVKIATRRVEDEVRVEISDTGAGIPEAEMERIFDPFFTTKPCGEGTGLGLSISFRIVEQHGGSIKVESRVGVGTKFTVSIPATRSRTHNIR